MFKPLALCIGLRYTLAKSRNGFISFISLTSLLGIALGVAVLITVLSVMNGFDQEIRNRFFSMARQVTINGLGDGLSDWEHLGKSIDESSKVIASAPYVGGQGLLTLGNQSRPVIMNGILPVEETKISALANHMTRGALAALRPGSYGIILGAQLALSLDLDLADKVNVLVPKVTVTPFEVMPTFKRFTVVGIFTIGKGFGYDNNLAFIHLNDAQTLFRLGDKISGFNVKIRDLYDAPVVSEQLLKNLSGNFTVSDWTRDYGYFFKAIQLEKNMMFLILLLIIAVAAFNLVSGLVMVVNDKRSDIAILETMGANPLMILIIFIVQGLLIGGFGTALGVVMGIFLANHATAVVTFIQHYFHIQLINPNIYYLDYLPTCLIESDIVKISLAALSMSFIATVYPSWRASQVNPAEVLRYE